ncbi:hypothetical protein H6P81_009072 [Aristolochia fimbriata]|uniref:RING-type domain-containing protein n=1 Tax=Aristolochia fimbriata TaxID=158543 RepID=A0AAV7EJT3_ARIFI|nr:hypothetical protein H6P81_009072 [Aristolochia fimbriata]
MSTTILPTSPPLDLCFDLDVVLTNGDDSGTTPAAEKFVYNLPTVATAGGGGSSCTVCMEDFEPERGGKRLPCSHVFHESCISSWLSLGDSCPLCRYQLSQRV